MSPAIATENPLNRSMSLPPKNAANTPARPYTTSSIGTSTSLRPAEERTMGAKKVVMEYWHQAKSRATSPSTSTAGRRKGENCSLSVAFAGFGV